MSQAYSLQKLCLCISALLRGGVRSARQLDLDNLLTRSAGPTAETFANFGGAKLTFKSIGSLLGFTKITWTSAFHNRSFRELSSGDDWPRAFLLKRKP